MLGPFEGLEKGWDVFIVDPSTVEMLTCPTCSARMAVERGVVGPTSMAGALAGKSHPHDRFTCAQAGEVWHKQAKTLLQLARRTPSARLAALYQMEADDLLRTRVATKERWGDLA